jgi:archaemetzincin
MRQFGRFAWVVFLATGVAFGAFKPRSAEERAAALGDLTDVPAPFCHLLSSDRDFNLIPLPQPGDWLAAHSEPGQSFAAFDAARPNRPDATRRIIYLLPLGDFPPGSSPSLKILRGYAAAFFQMEVKILPVHQPAAMEFSPRVNPHTKQVQLLTPALLKFLGTQLPADAFCLLGITMEDLYPSPSWNYVFGQASLWDRVGVYSFARYDPDFFGTARPENYRHLVLLRSCKVLVHETGHMFGLQHCIYYDCVLNGSNHLAETDSRPVHLCPICLRKMQHSVGFDAVRRYKELARFYRAQDFTAESEWCERQIAKAAGSR